MTAPLSSPPGTVSVSAALRPVFDQFLGIQRSQIDAIETARLAGDPETVALLAHAVKGSAATYQLPEAAALARDLEAKARDADLAGAAPLVSALERYFRDIAVVFIE